MFVLIRGTFCMKMTYMPVESLASWLLKQHQVCFVPYLIGTNIDYGDKGRK
jgi:hypothetical protein